MISILKDVLTNIATFKEEAPIFVLRIEGDFRPDSEAVVLELAEEEADLRTDEIAALKCPGFDYFLDVFIVQEMVADFENASRPVPFDERINTIINYAEYDA